MNHDEARTVIAEALGGIAPEASLDGVDPDEEMQDAFDLDSMDFLNLMVAIHERTGVEIPERDYPIVATLGGCASYLVERS